MNKILLSFVAVAALTVSGLCVAAGPQLANGNPVPVAGPYVGIQAGLGGMDTPNFSSDVKNAVKELGGEYSENNSWGFAGRLFGGYLWCANKFQYGLELGGMIYPRNKYKLVLDVPDPSPVSIVSVKIKYQGYLIDLLGVVKYNFTSAWNVFAKEGVAYAHQKVTASAMADVSNTVQPVSRSKKDAENRLLPEVAVGIGYYLIPNVELSLTYNHVFGNELTLNNESAASKVASVNGLMLGATIVI